jgi:3-hydroxyisobutyrate dehydrogenase-like beta-hydroxyacid dehydrogenase
MRRITDCVSSLAGAVIDFSDEKHGQASLLKIVGNVLIMTAIEQVSELMVFSEKSGLGVNNLRKLFAAMYPGGPIKQHLLYQGHMASGEWARKVVSTLQPKRHTGVKNA